jgi:hypothetical protein
VSLPDSPLASELLFLYVVVVVVVVVRVVVVVVVVVDSCLVYVRYDALLIVQSSVTTPGSTKTMYKSHKSTNTTRIARNAVARVFCQRQNGSVNNAELFDFTTP